MVIMRVWTLAHTSPLLSLCYFAPFCRKFCWVGVEFLSSGAQGLFPPRKKQSTLNSTMFFLPHVLPPFFPQVFVLQKKQTHQLLMFHRDLWVWDQPISPLKWNQQRRAKFQDHLHKTAGLTKKCTDGNHFSWRWTSPFWGVFWCLGYWSIFSTCEEYVWSTWYI